MDDLIPLERIAGHIHLLRGVKVMLDRDLAALYGVPTKALKQAVKRNISRFPEDFMFEMLPEEWERLRSQFVTSKADKKGLRHPPYAFTEQGVAMLSSVMISFTFHSNWVDVENTRAGINPAPTKRLAAFALDFVGAGFIPARVLSVA